MPNDALKFYYVFWFFDRHIVAIFHIVKITTNLNLQYVREIY